MLCPTALWISQGHSHLLVKTIRSWSLTQCPGCFIKTLRATMDCFSSTSFPDGFRDLFPRRQSSWRKHSSLPSQNRSFLAHAVALVGQWKNNECFQWVSKCQQTVCFVIKRETHLLLVLFLLGHFTFLASIFLPRMNSLRLSWLVSLWFFSIGSDIAFGS